MIVRVTGLISSAIGLKKKNPLQVMLSWLKSDSGNVTEHFPVAEVDASFLRRKSEW